MEDVKARCAGCGTDVPSDAPLGLCPACLLKRAMAASTADGRSSAGGWIGGFDPPPVEQLAPLFPQLEVLELIGRGGMGAVYKARQIHLDRFVAIKILPTSIADDATFAERFAREARSLARLSHANIVTVHDFGRAGPFFYFVMEFVDGANLRQALVAKTLEPKQALAIVPQICDALQYAHDEGIVHRDIKPENVLLDKKGRVKIADFGLAKLLQKTPQNYTLTQTYVTMGTPHYMAPEQTEHPLEVDHRADIYSLGVVFYEMLTGELPLGRFAAPSQKSQCDARLDDVVFKTLEKEPGRRYQQASEVKTSVQEVSQATPLRPPAPPDPVIPYAQRHAPSNPRYSKVAVAGVIWGGLGFGLLVAPLTGAPAIIALPFLLFALTSMAGMTACGLIAIAQIRGSKGRLYGLGLATLDAVIVPLLLLNAAIVLFTGAGAGIVFGLSWAEGIAISTAIGLPVCIVIDFLIARFLWRRVSAGMLEHAAWRPTVAGAAVESEQPARSTEAPVVPYGAGSRYSRTALCGAVWAVVGLLAPILLTASYLLVGQSAPTARGAAVVVTPPAPRARSGAAQTPPSTMPTRSVSRGERGSGGVTILAPQNPGLSDPAWLGQDAMFDEAIIDATMSEPMDVEATGIDPLSGGGGGGAARQRSSSVTGASASVSVGGSGPTFTRVTVTPPPTPVWSSAFGTRLKILLLPVLSIGFTAPFGATILGLVAISQIRRSSGRLYGMPLALFDTLLYPLILLDVLIVALVAAVLTRAGDAGPTATAVAVIIGLAAAVATDVWIVRRVRDAATSGTMAG